MITLFHVALIAVLFLAAYALYKYKTVAGVEAELKSLEATGEADAKKVIAAIKAKL